MVLQMGAHELGIAVDTKMRTEDVKALIQLLCTFRRSVEQLSMDSPIIELLVSQVNNNSTNSNCEFECFFYRSTGSK